MYIHVKQKSRIDYIIFIDIFNSFLYKCFFFRFAVSRNIYAIYSYVPGELNHKIKSQKLTEIFAYILVCRVHYYLRAPPEYKMVVNVYYQRTLDHETAVVKAVHS